MPQNDKYFSHENNATQEGDKNSSREDVPERIDDSTPRNDSIDSNP